MRVIRPLFFAIAFVLGASLAGRADSKPDPTLDAVPAGLVPTTTKLSLVLAQHEASLGTVPKTLSEDWSFVDTGLHGTEHLVRAGTDYHSIIHNDAITEEYGQLGGKRWHKDTAGYTTPTTRAEDVTFTAVQVTEDAADPKSDVSLAGETAGSAPAYVIKVTKPNAKHPEWVFYDASTYRVVRFERVLGRHRLATTFDDFRTTDGVTQAWHIHDYYWTSEFDDDWHLTAYKAAAAIKPGEFARPANPIAPGVAVRTVLPSQFAGTAIIVRLTIGGRGMDFDLDPSVRSSFIDYDVAQQLQLPSFGKVTKLANGDGVPYDTIIPDADLGPIHLHDFPVHATDVAWYPNDSTRVVGTLGYDFLAANIIHVDYVHHLVEAIPTSAFAPEPAKPVANELDIPMQFDDGTLLVPMAIGDGFTERAILSTDMPFTVAFGGYVRAHALTSDAKRVNSFVPFADNASYGRSIDVWMVETNVLTFANLNFSDLPIVATDEAYDERDIDAIVGYDYVAFYDIYFDYPHDRLLLVPNDRFYQLTKAVKPVAQ